MALIPAEILDAMRSATCAIGYSRVPVADFSRDPLSPDFIICGTGFLIADSVVLTNRHVIQRLNAAIEKVGLPDHNRLLWFALPTHPSTLKNYYLPFGPGVVVDTARFDLATVSFPRPVDPIFQPARALSVRSPYHVTAGEEVGVFGFAFGRDHLLRPDDAGKDRVYRFGPILQRGYVAAIAPFEHSIRIDRLLLDVRTSVAMSGAAVFEPYTGTVIGIHEGGREAVTAFALPLWQPTIDALLTAQAMAERGGGFSLDVPVPENELLRGD